MATAKAIAARGMRSASTAWWNDWLWAPVLSGPLKGFSWRLTSRGKILRVLFGSYEREQTALFQQYIRSGDCVLDIGAASGYYSLLSARLVGQVGRVVAFEPDARNLHVLKSHLSANRLSCVTVRDCALSDQTGVVRFGGGTGSGTGRICDSGVAEVTTRRLDDVADEMQLHPTHLKIDVEGAELAVLRGGERTIRRCRPVLFLSTHPSIVPTVHDDCCRLLTAWNYELRPILGGDLARTTEVLALPRSA